MLGLLGTTKLPGSPAGWRHEQIPTVDAKLERLADIVGRRRLCSPVPAPVVGSAMPCLLVGAEKAPGLRTVMDEIGLAGRVAEADLVVTGEEVFDLRSGSGLIATGVAMLAGSVVTPCIALANRVAVGSRETRALGIESAYAVQDRRGDADPGSRRPIGSPRSPSGWRERGRGRGERC